MNYYFEDFTRENYKALIALALKKYTFITFDELGSDASNKILWRHDIDFSMHSALKLAQIEAEMGVRANYFILPHSEFYNIFEKEVTEILFKIKELGHNIGLHFDSHYYEITLEDDLEDYLLKEVELFRSIFNIEIRAFSFHNTTEFTMSCEKEAYAGLFNVYTESIKKNYDYCSDSNGYWKYRRLKDFLMDDSIKNAQVLTHPAWWQDEVMSPSDRIKRVVHGRSNNVLSEYREALSKFGNFDVS
ncbi:polysaccharide deacetylase family protein [Roseivirga echinicomitans]|uniref:NodB homology domain-containing protein n=1 Tax=Roseivirga echinicomitans TaxID=296218 RepID=A0A150XQZ4_9BACT|nr:hypothetical protein [Roseivirga echinicomitans]KYG81133.1 hypothetical protein AWN68_16475 [Roseivirga echinicomitans]